MEELNGKEEKEKVIQKRMQVRSGISKDVLLELIHESKLFEFSSLDPAEIAYRNVVVGLLYKMGFNDEANIKRIVDFLYTLPIVGEVQSTSTATEQ